MQAFNVDIWRGEKFYIAQCLEHSNCFTQGETIEEAIRNVKEVIELILEVRHPWVIVHLKDELVEALSVDKTIKLRSPLVGQDGSFREGVKGPARC